MLDKVLGLGKSFLASNLSGYLSIGLAAFISVASFYVYDRNKEIEQLKQSLIDCNVNNANAISELEQERLNNNFEVERDVLVANHVAELNKRRELEKLVLELQKKNDKVNEDNKKVNEKVSKLEGRCLEFKVGANAEVFNEIFN